MIAELRVFGNMTQNDANLQLRENLKAVKQIAESILSNMDFLAGRIKFEEKAKEVFIKHKEAAILAKADIYKDRIPRALYDAMVNWKMELADWNN